MMVLVAMSRTIGKRMSSRLALLLFCAVLIDQSAASASRPKTFHISGTVTRSGKAFSHDWVTFEGESPMSVQADPTGAYEADLPLGVWTATVTMRPYTSTDVPGTRDNPRFSRPRVFSVAKPSNVVLDLFVRPPVVCDMAGPLDTTPEQWDHIHAHCAGEEFFAVPSADGTPFEVIVGGRDHQLCSLKGEDKAACDREFATYDLFSVRADKIVYKSHEWTLETSGKVVVKDEHGEYRRDWANFFIGDGRVVPIY
jgi:hypothetical protein